MNKKLIASICSAALAATGISLALVPAAHADTTVTLRGTDLLPGLADVRAQGHVQFADNGLSVVTDAFTSGTSGLSKAAEYWDTDVTLADAGEPALDWSGTDTKPGVNLYVDLDGDPATGMYGNTAYRGADAILVGEDVYRDENGTPDWWATASAVLDNGAPATTGGSGSARHGTLDGWRGLYPDARVVAEGFSLGSGGRGSGIIDKMTLGTTTYEFTGKDKVVPVTPPGQLAAPGGLKVTATSANTVSLSWDAVPGAGNYQVFEGGVAANVGSSWDTTAVIGGLQFNRSYTFTVAAGQIGTEATGQASAPVKATTATVTLAAPTGLKVTSATATTLVVAAGAVPFADHYLWYVDGVAHGSSDNPTYTIRGLKGKTHYQLAVAADTITTVPGPNSATITGTTR